MSLSMLKILKNIVLDSILNLHIIIVFIVTKVPQVDYCASKFACVGLDEALRVETLVQVISALIDLYSTPLLMQKFPTS